MMRIMMTRTSTSSRRLTPQLVLCAALSLIATLPVSAQSRDPLFNIAARQAGGIPTYGDMMADVLDSFKDARNLTAAITDHLRKARRSYWDARSRGALTPEIERAYATALLQKDAYYLQIGSRGAFSSDKGGFNAFNLISGGIDGGIHPGAQHAFGQILRNAKTNDPDEAERLLREYLWRRDLLEHKSVGVRPPVFTAERWDAFKLVCDYLVYRADNRQQDVNRFMRSPIDPVGFALDEVESAIELFGEDRVSETVSRIRDTAYNRDFLLAAPMKSAPALGVIASTNVMEAFYNALASDSNQHWFIAVRRMHRGWESPSTLPLQEAAEDWDHLVSTYGQSEVDAAVSRHRELATMIDEGYFNTRVIAVRDAKAVDVEPERRRNYAYADNAVQRSLEQRTYTRYERIQTGGAAWKTEELAPLAERGIPWAQVEWVKLHTDAENWTYDYSGDQRALDWLVSIVEKRDPASREAVGDAAFLLGHFALSGVIAGDDEAALHYFTIGSRNLSGEARAMRIVMILEGRGLSATSTRPSQGELGSMINSLDQDDPAALYAIGLFSRARQDDLQAEMWMRSSAEEGFPPAIAWCRQNGVTVRSKAEPKAKHDTPDRSRDQRRRRRGRD